MHRKEKAIQRLEQKKQHEEKVATISDERNDSYLDKDVLTPYKASQLDLSRSKSFSYSAQETPLKEPYEDDELVKEKKRRAASLRPRGRGRGRGRGRVRVRGGRSVSQSAPSTPDDGDRPQTRGTGRSRGRGSGGNSRGPPPSIRHSVAEPLETIQEHRGTYPTIQEHGGKYPIPDLDAHNDPNNVSKSHKESRSHDVPSNNNTLNKEPLVESQGITKTQSPQRLEKQNSKEETTNPETRSSDATIKDQSQKAIEEPPNESQKRHLSEQTQVTPLQTLPTAQPQRPKRPLSIQSQRHVPQHEESTAPHAETQRQERPLSIQSQRPASEQKSQHSSLQPNTAADQPKRPQSEQYPKQDLHSQPDTSKQGNIFTNLVKRNEGKHEETQETSQSKPSNASQSQNPSQPLPPQTQSETVAQIEPQPAPPPAMKIFTITRLKGLFSKRRKSEPPPTALKQEPIPTPKPNQKPNEIPSAFHEQSASPLPTNDTSTEAPLESQELQQGHTNKPDVSETQSKTPSINASMLSVRSSAAIEKTVPASRESKRSRWGLLRSIQIFSRNSKKDPDLNQIDNSDKSQTATDTTSEIHKDTLAPESENKPSIPLTPNSIPLPSSAQSNRTHEVQSVLSNKIIHEPPKSARSEIVVPEEQNTTSSPITSLDHVPVKISPRASSPNMKSDTPMTPSKLKSGTREKSPEVEETSKVIPVNQENNAMQPEANTSAKMKSKGSAKSQETPKADKDESEAKPSSKNSVTLPLSDKIESEGLAKCQKTKEAVTDGIESAKMKSEGSTKSQETSKADNDEIEAKPSPTNSVAPPLSAKSDKLPTSSKSTHIPPPPTAKSEAFSELASLKSISPTISENLPRSSKSLRSNTSLSPSQLEIDDNSAQNSSICKSWTISERRYSPSRSLPISRSHTSVHETPRQSLERESSRPIIIIQATSPSNENFKRTLKEALGDQFDTENLKLPPIPQARNSSKQQTSNQPLNISFPPAPQIPHLPPIPIPYNYYPYHHPPPPPPPPPPFGMPPYGYPPYGYPHMMPPPPPLPHPHPFMTAPQPYIQQVTQTETGNRQPLVSNGSEQKESVSQVTPRNDQSETKTETRNNPPVNADGPSEAQKQISPRYKPEETSKPRKKLKYKRPIHISVGDRPPSHFYERYPNLPCGRSFETMDSKPIQDDPSKPSFGSQPPANFRTADGPSYFDLSSRRHSESNMDFYREEQFEESDGDDIIHEKLKSKKKRSKKKDKMFEETFKQEYEEMKKEEKRLNEAERARKAAESPIPFDTDLTRLLTLIETGKETPSERTPPRPLLPSDERFDKSEDNPIEMEPVTKSKTPSEASSDVLEYERLLAKYDEENQNAEENGSKDGNNSVKEILDKNLEEQNKKEPTTENFTNDDIDDEFYNNFKRKKKRKKKKGVSEDELIRKISQASDKRKKQDKPLDAFGEMLRELTQEMNTLRPLKHIKPKPKPKRSESATPDSEMSKGPPLLASPSDSMIISEIRKKAREEIRKQEERNKELKQGDIAINRLVRQLTKEANEATQQIEQRKKLKNDLDLEYFMNTNGSPHGSEDDPTTPEDIEVYAMKNRYLTNIYKGVHAVSTPAFAPSRESSAGSGQNHENGYSGRDSSFTEKENIHSQVLLAEAQKKILLARNMLQKYSL